MGEWSGAAQGGGRRAAGKLTGPQGHPGDDPAAWPLHLQSLVQQYGGDRVHRAGLAHLQYPPAWTAGVGECRGLFEALLKTN